MITDMIFDLDDTLCDFSAARQRGVVRACDALPQEWRAAAVEVWLSTEPGLYAAFAAGQIPRETYRWLRFHKTLQALGQVPADPAAELRLVAAMNDAFMQEINGGVTLAPGAHACLIALADRGLNCHVLTNGPADSQRRRLARLGLMPHLTQVFIAEEIGHFKPDPAAFAYVLERLGRPANAVVMIGDDVGADVTPAVRLGLHAIHYAPRGSDVLPNVGRLTDVPEAIDRLQLGG